VNRGVAATYSLELFGRKDVAGEKKKRAGLEALGQMRPMFFQKMKGEGKASRLSRWQGDGEKSARIPGQWEKGAAAGGHG